MAFMNLLNEPIQRKVIVLVSILLGLCIMFICVESVGDRFTAKLKQAAVNEESRGRLVKAILHELLLIENNTARLISGRQGPDVEAMSARLQDEVANLMACSLVLRQGGSFNYSYSLDLHNIHEVRETIDYQAGVDESSGLTGLASGVGTIKQLVDSMTFALHDPSTRQSPNLWGDAADLGRALDAQITRLRETISPTVYEASQKVGRFRAEMAQARRALDHVRYSASAVIFATVLILCVRTLLQIGAILEQKKSYAHHLRRSKESIHQILEALPVGVLLIDENRTIRHINRTALDMIGAGEDEARVGRRCTELLCSLEEDQCPFHSGPGASFSNEIYLRSKTGINPVVLRKAIALSIEGESMVLETCMDISALKRDEQGLIEKQNYINKILQAAMVGILVVDGTDFTIVEANPAATEMIGAPRQALIGSLCHQWICNQSTDNCPVIHIGQSLDNAESELRTADGRAVPIVKNVAMALLNGRMHLVESFVDITRLKAAEEEARRLNEELEQRVAQRTAQLKKANLDLKTALQDLKEAQSRLLQSEKMASIGQLAAGVAHEINNPVGFVKSNLYAVDDYRKDLTLLIEAYEALTAFLNQPEQPDGQVKTYLGEVEQIKQDIDFGFIMGDFENVISESLEGLVRVAKIIADLKHFAHMKADETEWVDINTNIESTLNIVWNELKYKAEVIKELGELPHVRCFPQRINQVVMNLLVNAGQAIRERGRILIKTSAANGHVKIAISDNGEGIIPENIHKIFDPFFTTKEVGKGTGLGLNVVYNIVKSHKGNIDVESTPGRGTTFTIELPVEPHFDNTVELN